MLNRVCLLTLGHGTLPIETFIQLARDAEIQHIVDIRTVPKSKHNPQFERTRMEGWLSQASFSYRWKPELGGFRRPLPDSKNIALRNPAFRGFADYMQTPQFWLAFDELLEEAEVARTAIMCSESLWWRCHRRLIADAAVLTRGVDVQDLTHDGKVVAHRVTEGARVHDSLVVYDVIARAPLLDRP